MKTTFKRMLALLLCLALCVSLLPATVQGEGAEGETPDEAAEAAAPVDEPAAEALPDEAADEPEAEPAGDVAETEPADEAGEASAEPEEPAEPAPEEAPEELFDEPELESLEPRGTAPVVVDRGRYLEITVDETTCYAGFVLSDEGVYCSSVLLADIPYDWNNTDSAVFPLRFALATGDSFDDSESKLTLVTDDDLLSKLTVKNVTFPGTSEDGSALPAEVFSWDDSSQTGSLSYSPGPGYSGRLTASIAFDGVDYTVIQDISIHIDRKAYLAFADKDGDCEGIIVNCESAPLVGKLRLYVWNYGVQGYEDRGLLTAEQVQTLTVSSDVVALSFGGTTPDHEPGGQLQPLHRGGRPGPGHGLFHLGQQDAHGQI